MKKKRRYDKISTYFIMNLKVVIPMCITALFFDGLMSLIPRIEGETINSLKSGDFTKVWHYVLIFIGLVLFVQINRFFKRFLVRVFGNKMTLTMRKKSLENLINRDISYFTSHSAGDILNRNLSDIGDTTEGIRKMTTEVFDTIVLLIGYLISLFLMNPYVTLITMIFIALSILSSHLMKKAVYKTNKEYKEYLSINKEITITKLNNELYCRGLGVSDNYFKEYELSANTLRKKNMKALLFQSSLEPLYSSVALMGVFFIIWLEGKNVISGIDEIGTLTALLTTYLLVARKAAKVGKVFNAYQAFKVSWVRSREYLKDEVVEDKTYTLNGDILSIKNFYYQYNDSFKTPSITLDIKRGECIGICGMVHTGKSTILKALTGLYEYSGEAFIDGICLSDIIKSNKQYIAYCASDVSMFSDTLENNIKLERDGNLENALNASRLSIDLDEIGGLEAQMSHTNSNISGGQQKRVQMARALYADAPICLLDDPFQSVSADMALEMVDCLKCNNKRMVLLVSNNKNILEKMDKIIYLDYDKAIIDTYDNLCKNEKFKDLMGV